MKRGDPVVCQGVTVGRNVHYVYGLKGEEFVHCAAIVVKVYKDSDMADLHVFYPEKGYMGDGTGRVEKVPYSSTPSPITWHWPEVTRTDIRR